MHILETVFWALAARPNTEFVLTLDHDSVVPEEFVSRLQDEFDSRDKALRLAAVGPTLIDPRVDAPVGFQRRRDTGDINFDATVNANNLDFAYGANDWDGSLTTTAYFAEIGIPLLDNLQVNLHR